MLLVSRVFRDAQIVDGRLGSVAWRRTTVAKAPGITGRGPGSGAGREQGQAKVAVMADARQAKSGLRGSGHTGLGRARTHARPMVAVRA